MGLSFASYLGDLLRIHAASGDVRGRDSASTEGIKAYHLFVASVLIG